MPQRCSIPGCRTGYKQGLMLLCYPKDPGRRSAWVQGVRTAGLEPTNMHFICELHFGPDQWEKVRVDGTRKLKWSGVPNKFSPEEIASNLDTVRAVSEIRQRTRGLLKRKGYTEMRELKLEATSAYSPNIRKVIKLDKICKSIATPPPDARSKFQPSTVHNSIRAVAHSSLHINKLIESPASVCKVDNAAPLLLKSHEAVVQVNSCIRELSKPQNPVVNTIINDRPIELRLPLSEQSHSIIVKLPKSRFQNSLAEDLEDVRSFLNETERTYEQRLINAISELANKHRLLDEKMQISQGILVENCFLKEKLKDHDRVLIENNTLKEKLREHEERTIVKNVFLKETVGIDKGKVIKIGRVKGALSQVGTDCNTDNKKLVSPVVTLVGPKSTLDQKTSLFVSLDDQL